MAGSALNPAGDPPPGAGIPESAARSEVAETADSDTDAKVPGEIVVTARRRAERIQDVPIAAQALSGEAMQAYNLQTAADLARIVPSLSFSGSFETIPKITIRGVGTSEFTANVNPAVGLYIDDVYQGLGAGQNFQLFDIERVEVLRGPQGTFVGKNSTGGAVQYYTSDPIDVPAGRVEVGYGRFDRFETEAMINVPLGEGIAFRLSGTTTDRDGYWNNRELGIRDGRIDRWALRGKLKLDLGENVTVLLKLAHGEADDDLRRSRRSDGLYRGSDLLSGQGRPANL
jgi:iron complex outermembrane recepter protein